MKNLIAKSCLASLLLASGLAFGTEPATKPPAKAPAAKAPAAKPEPTTPAATQGNTLKIGSDAPALSVDKWIKGAEISTLEKGKTYVVEFWATWCGPCRESIPHLTELSKKYKDVTFIGVAGSERKGKTSDDRVTKLEKFVKDQGAKMGYSVAYDESGKTVAAYMDASGQQGIPCAFVVDAEGKIAYIGHPMEPGFEQTLAKVSKGKAEGTKEKDESGKDKKKKAKSRGG